MEVFRGRKLVIATKHRKELAIAGPLIAGLNITPFVPEDFDSDQFGTFTGEIRRLGTPLENARKKAVLAAKRENATLAVASEGSFGPHPTLPFVSSDEEVLLLIDLKNGYEIHASYLTHETNFCGSSIDRTADLQTFSEEIGFPEHGIILKANDRSGESYIFKDFPNTASLCQKANKLLENQFRLSAETDMRAMNNPTRMRAIGEAAKILVEKVKSTCPGCSAPGYGVVETIIGLPCKQCRMPTRSIKARVYRCAYCGFTEEKINPKKIAEDPMYCDWCNP
ncbi:MAG: DUF6671 family protein [Cryomorphaceae bacterium]